MLIHIDFSERTKALHDLEKLKQPSQTREGVSLFSDGEKLYLLHDGECIATWDAVEFQRYMSQRRAALYRARRRLKRSACEHEFNTVRTCKKCGWVRPRKYKKCLAANPAHGWWLRDASTHGRRRRRVGHEGPHSWEKAS